MAEQINNNCNEPSFLKALIVYCYNKMIKNEIFRYEEIVKAIIISKKTASQMDQNEKILILLNLKNFQTFIIEEKNGFLYKKAFLSFIFRCLLLIFQIMILSLITYPKNLCIDG